MEFNKLTSYLDSLEKEYGVPGLDCKIMKGHEVVYRHTSGYSDEEKRKPVSKNDIYRIYSATKLITMISIMQLVEKGKISLYDDVAKYLPEYETMKVVDEFKVGEWPFERPAPDAKMHKAKDSIRIIDLMTMTSGMSYDIESPEIANVVLNSDNKATSRELVKAMADMPLICDPRTRWAYNLGHDVLAVVVEVVTGKTYGHYLEECIFKPLEIEDMYFHLNDKLTKRLSAQYLADFETDEIKPVENTNRFQLSERYESGGAGLATTVDEYSKVIDALANGGVGANGARILTQESIDMLSGDHLNDQEREDFSKSGKVGYSYGLGVRTLIDDSHSKSPVGEFGWDGAAGAYLLVDPKNKISIFYAHQILGFLKAYTEIHPTIRDLAYEGLEQ